MFWLEWLRWRLSEYELMRRAQRGSWKDSFLLALRWLANVLLWVIGLTLATWVLLLVVAFINKSLAA